MFRNERATCSKFCRNRSPANTAITGQLRFEEEWIGYDLLAEPSAHRHSRPAYILSEDACLDDMKCRRTGRDATAATRFSEEGS